MDYMHGLFCWMLRSSSELSRLGFLIFPWFASFVLCKASFLVCHLLLSLSLRATFA